MAKHKDHRRKNNKCKAGTKKTQIQKRINTESDTNLRKQNRHKYKKRQIEKRYKCKKQKYKPQTQKMHKCKKTKILFIHNFWFVPKTRSKMRTIPKNVTIYIPRK